MRRTSLFSFFFAPLAFAAYAAAAGSCAKQDPTGGSGGTGGQAGTPQCVGKTASDDCAGKNVYACLSIRGCTAVGDCVGTPLSCAAFPTSDSCADQAGCAWAQATTCSGNPTPCNNLQQAQCSAQQGCTWDSFNWFCSGVPTQCAQVPNCAQQQGCFQSSTMACQGVAKGCDTLKNFVACSLQAGCGWDGECQGTPTACGDLALEKCDSQPGCACQNCEGAIPPPPTEIECVFGTDCDTVAYPCLTGNCINGFCDEKPSCSACSEQQDCNPLNDPCFTGNCVNSNCETLPGCASCKSSLDCQKTSNPCYTGDCSNGVCGLVTACAGGDACCPSGCTSLTDSDC